MRAWEWAEKRGVSEPYVVGAAIEIGYCLDLVEREYLEVVRKARQSISNIYNTSGLALPTNEPGCRGDDDLVKRRLDCAVFDHLHELRGKFGDPAFDTIGCPFSEGRPLYDGGKIMERTHIQICVRNTNAIIGYFKPLRHVP